MTTVIHKEDWKEFFDRLSREKLDWETSVQVLSSETGAQYLSEGLPLTGLVYDEKAAGKIEISVGTGAGQHQTHNIFDPKFAAYETLEDKSSLFSTSKRRTATRPSSNLKSRFRRSLTVRKTKL